MNKKLIQFKWLVTTFLLVAAMVVPTQAWADNTMYTVYKKENAKGTLTFYYGEKPSSAGDGETLYDVPTSSQTTPGWHDVSTSIEKVVFHQSFASARPITCYYWFCGCSSLKYVQNIENLNTSNVTDMQYMFINCNSLTSLDLSKFNTSKVTDMQYMFYNCKSLKSLDLSMFNTSKVTNMQYMFYRCSSLKSLNLSSFDNSQLTTTEWMFYECSSLKSLNLSSFGTSNVTTMYNMFNGCSSLRILDLTSFNTSKANYMAHMFKGCSNLTAIYVSNSFNTYNVSQSSDMFLDCTKLRGALPYSSTNADKTRANYTSGYFSYGINSVADLKEFSRLVKDVNTNICGGLMTDIALTGEDGFESIGSSKAFTGIFNGAGHTISYSGGANPCLFATNNGIIKNLCVQNMTIAGENNGTINRCYFWESGKFCNSNSKTISNCYYMSDSETDALDGTTAKTAEQFKSGEVTWLLNGGTANGTTSATTDGTQSWYQNLSNNNRPIGTNTGSSTVYQVDLLCGGVYLVGKTYSNVDEKAFLEHIPSNNNITFNSGKQIYQGACQRQGEGCGATLYYADAAGEIKANANEDETAFTVTSLTLEDATAYDNKCVYEVTDFTFNRTFPTTNWTTWYVPFELKLTEEICAKYDFSRINNIHQYDEDYDGNADRTVVESFRQKPGVTLKANYPYLVRAIGDVDKEMTLELQNVTPALADEVSIQCWSVDNTYTFTGTYNEMGDSGAGKTDPYTLYTDGKWYHFHRLSPMRHYLTITPQNSASASPAVLRSIVLTITGDEEATGIVTPYSQQRIATETYDLGGRRLPEGSQQRGLIIQNGKVIYKK